MRKYHVYGIGNALVDIEYQVSEAFIKQFGIEKQLMTLIDEKQHQHLLAHLGEIEANPLKASGGSAANTMIALSYLGAKTFYSCKVANDCAGDFYFEDLINAGVETNLSNQSRETGVTGNCIVLVTPDAQRTMNSHLGITAHFSERELVLDIVPQSAYVYLEGYLVGEINARKAMHAVLDKAKQHQTRVALTLSDVYMVRHFRKELDALLEKGIDILFCNEAEALSLANCDDVSLAADYLNQYASQVIITRSEHGALLFDGKSKQAIESHKVHVIDTLGAGDAFAGAFLYGLSHDLDFVECGHIANLAAAQVITQYGPRLKQAHATRVHDYLQEKAL